MESERRGGRGDSGSKRCSRDWSRMCCINEGISGGVPRCGWFLLGAKGCACVIFGVKRFVRRGVPAGGAYRLMGQLMVLSGGRAGVLEAVGGGADRRGVGRKIRLGKFCWSLRSGGGGGVS